MCKYTIIDGRQVRCFSHNEIVEAVKDLFISANSILPKCVNYDICSAIDSETDPLAKQVLHTIAENAKAAIDMNVPVCQDTGMAVVFIEIGSGIYLNCELESAVNEGVSRAYTEGYLRKSIVKDPLYKRVNTNDNTPAKINLTISSAPELYGKIKITAAPKGFGSENMSKLKMFTPSATEDEVVEFVVDSVKTAGSNPCPPIYVGVGIGSDFEGVALLAKKALLRETPSLDVNYKRLEERLLSEINALGIGPQGFGGDTTALGVYIETAPTHIAGLPVAVNINCHVARHKTIVLD
ncbi:MAG: fumarate hydratase [Clostridia bacterium]|nr:fumarate hydratase [Clostridia bacterium]